MSGKRGITRREFVKGAAVGTASLSLLRSNAFAAMPAGQAHRQPNILFIHTDQQHFQAVSALECRDVRTPNMDRLVKHGVTFSMSYSADPVCCPARAAWYTGRPSSENGMLSNQHKLRPDIPDLGQWFRSHGYETFYSGKWHIPGRALSGSFNTLTGEPSGQGEHCDPMVSRTAQAFLHSYTGDKPFFLNLGFLQPHDCCYWVFANVVDPVKLPYPWLENELPKLPANYNYNLEESETVRNHFKGIRNWTRAWSDLHWRYYIWNYYRMVEMADAEIGRVLDALEDSKFASNTLIVFTSDHGDGLARRKLWQKWFLYDEAVRVPMVVVPPGGADGRLDKSHVVSGLDVAPTLCDYAGIPTITKARGQSMRPLVEGKDTQREFIVSECNITGRMVRTPEYKLVTYKDDPPDQLFDMRRDPWETRNLAKDARHADRVADLKKLLREWEGKLEPGPPG